MKQLSNYDLNKNQLLNAVIQKLATDPSNPVSGQIYYNTVVNRLKYHNGTIFVNADSSDASMTGDAIVTAINGSTGTISDNRLSANISSALTKLSGVEANADVTDATNVGSSINGTTAKTALVDADLMTILNSASSNALSKITWANFKLSIKTYTDTLYNNYTHPTGDGNLHVPVTSTTNANKVLTAGATAGSLSWAFVDWANITSKPTSTVANIDDAVTKKHSQNTDTGTSSTTFQIGTSGAKLKNSGGTEVQVRNAGDTDYANLRVKNIYIEGDTTQINSNTVNIGDSEIELNSDNATSATNSDGGIAIKRLKADNTTRADAKMIYSESSNRWTSTQGAVAGVIVTAVVANKVTASIGDGTATSYVLTHNLNTMDLAVSLRETATPYAMVMTDIEFTSVNTITIKFAVAPTANQYTVVIVG